MRPPPGTLPVRALLAAVVTSVLAALTPLAAEARPADDVRQAKHHLLGSHVTNHHTHVATWIVGFYPYDRRVRIHHRWRAKRFYGLRISAQRCDRSHCWGRSVEGKLWSPHQPGRPVRRARRDQARGTAPRRDFCLMGTTVCAAPWNWLARYVDTRQRELVHRFVEPCATGSLQGGGVVAVKDLSARILFEGGVITAARVGSIFEGPPGIALGALVGCVVGEGSGGVHTIPDLVDALSPFSRGTASHV